MNGHYDECAVQEIVIDSLYAQRRQHFAKHGRSHSDSSHAFISSSSSSASKRERTHSAIFSIFRWFRKDSRSEDINLDFAPSAPPSPQLVKGFSASCGSVDTLFSTATASSFAFVHPSYYRPFGSANAPEKRIQAGPETETYRNRLRQRDRIRELDRNITLKKKYHLFGSGTIHRSAENVSGNYFFPNKSLDSLKVNDCSPGSKNSTLGRKKRKAPQPPSSEEKTKDDSLVPRLRNEKENTIGNTELNSSNVVVNRPRHRRTVSDSARDRKSGAFVHVRGKRKAPPPPSGSNNTEELKTSNNEVLRTQSLGRKKKHAPLPPLIIKREEGANNGCTSQGKLSPDEKQRLIENIAKLQAHADRQSLLLTTPPASPTTCNKMPHTVCNDSLKLERGVLKANKTEIQSPETKAAIPTSPTPVSPRPWYKRNVSSKEKSLEKKKDRNNIDDWMPEVAILRRSIINQESNNYNSSTNNSNNSNSNGYRLSSIFSKFEKPEEKRKSQISMLVNISELDREAAEIVQREQEKEKAMLAANDAKYYNSVTEPPDYKTTEQHEMEINYPEDGSGCKSAEAPKKTGARELISLFNAIGNVTKVTVNSAFFSKEGPSIFTKEGIEKRFSMTSESTKVTEVVVNEGSTKSSGYKREPVIEKSFVHSPGVKRRRNQYHQDSNSNDSLSEDSSSSVVIEEINNGGETEKSKIQALYEANKIRKHHSPSPSIPTIAEMSESVSSIATSTGSTVNFSERSGSITPTLITPSEEQPIHSVSDIPKKTTEKNEHNVTTKQPSKNYSIWSCPRCTLENPRWRVTCEACDMWRPAVRKDVIDKLTNANMGSTIAVNIVKGGNSKSSSSINTVTSEPVSTNVNTSIVPEKESRSPVNKVLSSASPNTSKSSYLKPITVSTNFGTSSVPEKERESPVNKVPSSATRNTSKSSYLKPITVSTNISTSSVPEKESKDSENKVLKITSPNTSKSVYLKPITVSGLLRGSTYEPENTTEHNKKEGETTRNAADPSMKTTVKSKDGPSNIVSLSLEHKEISEGIAGNSSFENKQKQPILETILGDKAIGSVCSAASVKSPSESKNDSEMEEVRKARLAFFDKNSTGTAEKEIDVGNDSKSKQSINQEKIDELFSIASRGSLATNESERLKIKELLKEMKNSLPKKRNSDKNEAGASVNNNTEMITKESIPGKLNSLDIQRDAMRLGAIKKSSVLNKNSASSDVTGTPLANTTSNSKKAEVYVVKSETIIEEIKVRGKDIPKASKVSSSAQTSGVIRKLESSSNGTKDVPVSGKPPTPKVTRKDIIVPVTVEEYVTSRDGVILTSKTKDTRKIGIGTFELMRPRDFANIGATKTGIEKEKAQVHVYANMPGTHHEDSSASSSSSSSSESPEIRQLTAELSKPRGLADFKASFLESTAGNKMNTLAVNRLLRQLEAAIVGGEHQRAATLAKELARHKVNCCVTRHKHSHLITVDMYVEDKLSHQGPFPIQVSPAMTVAQLKAKVEREFEIPVNVQRWILGKELATDDNATLQQLAVTKARSPVFLYLVAPDGAQDKVVTENETANTSVVTTAEEQAAGASSNLALPPPDRGRYFNEEEDRYSVCESEVTDLSSKDPSPEPEPPAAIQTPEAVVVELEEEAAALGGATGLEPSAAHNVETLTTGWKCQSCTLVNVPTRPSCLVCGTDRPGDYRAPADTEANTTEQHLLQVSAEEKLKNYQELMVLENADLIPSTEPFECSVCLVECAAHDGVVLRDCLHTFCRACLAHTVQFTDDAEVKCPFRDHNYACNSTLQEREIKAVCESEEDDSCIICMAEPRCCALTPCGHRAYCETCCLRLIELDQMCSLCRRKADGYLIIYL